MSTGASLPHDSATLHVTGQARYVDDIPTPKGTLHLAFGKATIARGQVTAMDLSNVRAAPGVVDVLTATDLPGDCDTSPSNHDEPLLSDGPVHFHGQPLFLVVAESHGAARRAAARAKVSYTEEEPILTIEAALAANSRFEDGPRIWARGDASAALATAPHKVEGRIEMGGQEHFYLEGQAALALPGEAGEMHVISSTQHPTEVQHKLAHALHLPMHAVRVECRRMGGGFGGKESQGNALAISCAVVAARTGRPVKMRYDRDDDMVITGKRHDFCIDYRAGFDTEGRLLGVDFTHYTRCGWSMDLSLPVADRAMLHADNAYYLPAVRIESHRLRTNMASATAYRGFGGPQGVLGIERVMDHIAHDLGLDPVLVRQRNYYDADRGGLSAPRPSGPPEDILKSRDGRNLTPYGQEVRGFALHEMTEALRASSDYHARRAAIYEWNAGQSVLKRGIALTPVKFGISFTLTHLNQAGALVHVYQDGSIQLNHGGTEMGQGLFQKVAQVAAEAFGLPMDVVKITATDTAKVPNTSATAASSGSDLNGMAVLAACETIRARIAQLLAGLNSCPPSDVLFQNGKVRAGKAEMSFAEAAMLAYQNRVSLSATGFYKTPDISWNRIAGRGRPFYYFAHGVAITEVVLDTLTGENRILRADILHDTGASLNPALDIGQVEGGYVQGAGWLTMEELVWDSKGRLRTHAPSTYKIPAASDTPDQFNVALWHKPNPEASVRRSKAVGEPPFMLGISAFMALSDALSAAAPGPYPALDAPATPEQLMMTLQKMRGLS